MIDLSTRYLGLPLRNPLVVSASPLGEVVGNLCRMEDAGAAAVVLPSLFEEQITLESQQLDRHLSHASESSAEALTYFPDLRHYRLGPDAYAEHVRRAKGAVAIPVIASLNGVSSGGWIDYARTMQQAGADAIELNVYFIPTDPGMTGTEVERLYVDLVRDVKASVTIPVAVKIGHAFTAVANVAQRLEAAGASGLVLFNRFYQPDFDLETLDVRPHLTLSTPADLLLRLHWTAILYGHVRADLAITGGVHMAEDVVKAMMAGARVAMMASALLERGIGHLARVREDLVAWMAAHDYDSVTQMQGSMSYRSVAQPSAFERANYMRVLGSFTLRQDPSLSPPWASR